jgi:hypothetical protein
MIHDVDPDNDYSVGALDPDLLRPTIKIGGIPGYTPTPTAA